MAPKGFHFFFIYGTIPYQILWECCLGKSSSHIFKRGKEGGRAGWGLASVSDNLHLISYKGRNVVLHWYSFRAGVAGNPWQQVTPHSGLSPQGRPHCRPFFIRDSCKTEAWCWLNISGVMKATWQEPPRGRKELQGHPAKRVSTGGSESTYQLWISPLKLHLPKCNTFHLNSIISKWYCLKKIRTQLFLLKKFACLGQSHNPSLEFSPAHFFSSFNYLLIYYCASIFLLIYWGYYFLFSSFFSPNVHLINSQAAFHTKSPSFNIFLLIRSLKKELLGFKNSFSKSFIGSTIRPSVLN